MSCYEFNYSFQVTVDHDDLEVICTTCINEGTLVEATKVFLQNVIALHGKQDLLTNEHYEFNLHSVQEVSDEEE